MPDRILKRIIHRNSPIRRLVSRHPVRVAGLAGAVVMTGAVLAMSRRRRSTMPEVEPLSVDGPGEPTRRELYEMARERNIPGRSSMTRAELKEALESA